MGVRSAIRRASTAMAVAAVVALGSAGCDPRPFPPPEVESFVHTAEVPPIAPTVDHLDETTVTLIGADGLHHVLAVKVAHRPDELRGGLTGVTDVPRGTGLLLLHPQDTDVEVSPGGLSMPLDHAFIDGDGQVLTVIRLRPCRADEPCVVVDPEVTYRAILQLPPNWLADHGIEAGATVEIGAIEPAVDA